MSKKNNISFIMTVVALALSIVTIVLFFLKVDSISVIDLGTFVGVIAAFIGICVTLLIGYQIYNAVDIKGRLEQITNLKNELYSANQKIERLQHELYEAIHIIQSRDPQLRNTYSPNVLLHFMEAIPHSLSLTEKSEGYGELMNELEKDMMNILLVSFGSGTQEVYEDGVKMMRDLLIDLDSAIRNHPNYHMIKFRYESLWNKFEKRLDIISRMKNPSLMYMDKEMGTEPEIRRNRQ